MHPHFAFEQRRLEETIRAIDGYLERHAHVMGRGADDWSGSRVYENQEDLVKKAGDARKELYFGRIDVRPDDGIEPEVYYLGHASFMDFQQGIQIFAWQDTEVGNLYYRPMLESDLGHLVLKRLITIEKDELKEISDDYVDADYDGDLVADRYTDSVLSHLLAQARGKQLREIVQTIQARQYEIITAPPDGLLVVEGPPGSGKTEVLLHRVSFLLFDAAAEGTKVPRILLSAPNRLFLSFASPVLSSLGENRLDQQVYDEWVLRTLGEETEYETQHESLEYLLEADAEPALKSMRYRNAQKKGSLKMGTLLERYCDYLHAESCAAFDEVGVQLYFPPISINVGQLSVRIAIDLLESGPITREEMVPLFEKAAKRPLNERRSYLEKETIAQFRTRISRELTDKAYEVGRQKVRDVLQLGQSNATRAAIRDVEGAIDNYIRNQGADAIVRQIRERFSEWRRENASVAYRRLLRAPELLHELGKGLFSVWDLELMHRDAPRAGTPFRFEDLGALHYFKLLLDGPGDEVYDHIVVDEAQDLTPLQFKVLSRYCPSGAMTVSGDLGQSIYAHHGVGDWDYLVEAAATDRSRLVRIEVSYRSTQEIIGYANEMLRRAGTAEGKLGKPFAREGLRPEHHLLTSIDTTAELIGEICNGERREATAIVCKTAGGCRRLAAQLRKRGFQAFREILDAESGYDGGTVILPVYLTKGLEFDTVIVADADEETYPADDLHLRLLYVAITRAAHEVHICYQDKISPLLDVSSGKAVPAAFGAQHLESEPVTAASYAEARPKVNADWCIERLAGADAMRLLWDGRIDATVLDVILHPYLESRVEPVGEGGIAPLPEAVQEAARKGVAEVINRYGRAADKHLAFTQVSYGLVRNRLRSASVITTDVTERSEGDQIVALVTFLRGLRQQNLMLGTGRWTTRKRVMESVSEEREESAETVLDRLIEHGLIEQRGDRIRLMSEWVPGVLALALGGNATEWDKDLTAGLACPPATYGWYTYVEREWDD